MSEISVLSNQYDKLVATSDKVNNSVITYKKSSLLNDANNRVLYPKLSVSGEDLDNAKIYLLDFLNNVKKLLSEDSQESDFIPNIIIDNYRNRLSKNQYLPEDLDSIINHLGADKSINQDEIAVLDGILTILDNERSSLFRKLRTARG